MFACPGDGGVTGTHATARRGTCIRGGHRQPPRKLCYAAPVESGYRLGSTAALKPTLETEREDDGRWLAEVPELPGVMAYGATRGEAMSKAEALAVRVLAERLEHGGAS